MPNYWGPKVRVCCAHCGWTGYRAKRSARLDASRCPKCKRSMPRPSDREAHVEALNERHAPRT